MHRMELHGTCSKPFQTLKELVETTWVLSPRAPQAKPAHEAKILGVTNTCGRTVNNPGAGQGLLKKDYILCSLTRLLPFIVTPPHCFGVTVCVQLDCFSLVALIQHDQPVEVFPTTPFN